MEAKPQFHGSDTAAVAAFYHVPVDEIVWMLKSEITCLKILQVPTNI